MNHLTKQKISTRIIYEMPYYIIIVNSKNDVLSMIIMITMFVILL
jgi:hypothetical protein